MTHLYPEIDHRRTELLDVGDGHTVAVYESGNPDGRPAIVLHGGPGGGSSPKQYRFFDPERYRIILMDQRGCGRSTPHASVEHNTTWHLVDDIERVREHLGIDRWLVFGGSWGSTLALSYAQTHPDRVTELVLRGIFLVRPDELRFFYQDGASHLFPDAWEGFVAPIPDSERDDLLGAYHRRLFGPDRDEMLRCARAWADWEHATATLESPKDPAFPGDPEAFARIENHYFVHGAFMDSPDQLLDGIDRIRHIPAVIVQGRYDVVCPVRTAWDLHRAWPEARLVVNPLAGHSMFDDQNAAALVAACDRFGDTAAGTSSAVPAG